MLVLRKCRIVDSLAISIRKNSERNIAFVCFYDKVETKIQLGRSNIAANFLFLFHGWSSCFFISFERENVEKQNYWLVLMSDSAKIRSL